MTCEQCGADTQYRTVKLELDDHHAHFFCSDGCERRWMLAQLRRWRRFLNRIYCGARGLARDVAHIALHTNAEP